MSSYEIEYLEEDEDIIQQYLFDPGYQTLPATPKSQDEEVLLVERSHLKGGSKRQRNDSSDDYAANQSDAEYQPETSKSKRSRKSSKTPSKSKTAKKDSKYSSNENRYVSKKSTAKLQKTLNHELQRAFLKQKIAEEILKQKEIILNRAKRDPMRKLHNIHFCDARDEKILSNKPKDQQNLIEKWNATCKTLESNIKSGNTESCQTVQYLRKIQKIANNRAIDHIRIYHETRADGKYTNLEAVLPFFEVKSLSINPRRNEVQRNYGVADLTDTILMKETTKEGEMLVAYKTFENRVATFEIVKGENSSRNKMRLLMTCTMCAKCYQYSWRGTKENIVRKEFECIACSSMFPSTYNLLSHLRNHSLTPEDRVRQNNLLAEIMPYHYNCRICQQKFDSILELKTHLRSHRSNTKFFCEVGRHITT